MKPSDIPSAIENVKGIMTIIIKDGINSLKSSQSKFWTPDKIRSDTYINAPDVAYIGTILAKGDKDYCKLIFDVPQLKEITEKFKDNYKMIGDNNAAKCILIPLKELFNKKTITERTVQW